MVVQEQSALPSPNSKCEPDADANLDPEFEADDETDTARTDSHVSQQSSTTR